MTENNAAQAVSEETRQAMGEALTEFMSESAEDGVFSIDPFDSRNVDGLLDVVLSKLRAPVADERALPPLPHIPTSYLQLKNLDKIHGMMRNYALAALASAPVAGEAQKPVATVHVRNNGYAMKLITYVAYALPEGRHDLYAAPQASEAQCPRCAIPLRQECNCDEGYTARAELQAIEAVRNTQADKDGGDCAKGEGDEPIAWESTTSAYIKFITDSRYQKFAPAVRKWYRPYRCSTCAALSPTQPTEQGERDE